MIDIRALATFVQDKIPACQFVGLSDQNELFLQFEHNNPEYMDEAKATVLKEFPEVTDVVSVVRPSLRQLTEMLDALNGMLEEKAPEEPPLLGIDKF